MAWTSSAHNGVKLDFQAKFDLKGHSQPPTPRAPHTHQWRSSLYANTQLRTHGFRSSVRLTIEIGQQCAKTIDPMKIAIGGSTCTSHSWTISYQIESAKTTFMEDVSTGVLEKIKNIYEVKIKPKMIWCIKTYIVAYIKIQKNEDILSSISNLPLPGLDAYFPQLDSRTTIKQHGLVRNQIILGHNDKIIFFLHL